MLYRVQIMQRQIVAKAPSLARFGYQCALSFAVEARAGVAGSLLGMKLPCL